ncbi:MAG: SMP-30/gluconolactonase/LRE family protein, partial [Longimicrobiales bacterium]
MAMRPESRSITSLLMAVILTAGCRSDPMAIEGEDEAGVADVVRQHHLEVGSVRPVVTFSAGESAEGIALDRRGNMYVGLRQLDPATGAFMRNEVVRIDRDGGVTSIADLGPASSDGAGVLGLATDRHGDVYAAFASGIIATRGVYRIASDGSSVERIAGSEGVTFPNGLAFDARGRLYATDSFDGAVWRYASGGAFEKWIEDPLLAPVAIPGFPPLPGVNGVVSRP